MAGLNFADDHVGRLSITLFVLIVWLIVLLVKPAEAGLVNGVAGIAIGHYFGKGSDDK